MRLILFFTTIFFGVTLIEASLPTRITPTLAYDWRTHQSQKSEIVVNILDTEVLNILERRGFSLSNTLGAKVGLSNTRLLFKNNTYYRDVANSIGKKIAHVKKTDQLPALIPPLQGDIPEMVRLLRHFEDKGKRSRKDLKGGYYISQLSNNSQHPYSVESDGDEPRHFDYRWLNSKHGYFKLIAIVNRIDKLDFDKNSCGEVRFIYRLSYQSKTGSSTLPFFLNVVHRYPKKQDCAQYAKKWIVEYSLSKKLRSLKDKAASHFSSFLINGALRDLAFKQLETNFQSLRFTSGYMQDFGGQAMYFQSVFKISKGHLIATPLENTPNVLAIEKSPALLTRFVKFLKHGNNLKKLDKGTLVINFEKEFLAKRSVSWSTLGRARTANKPYRRLFTNNKKLLKSIDISGLKYIKSYKALVERLDNMTCMGCHQSNGTAGFHMLGFADKRFSHGFNKQELPYSPHVYAESVRRKAYIHQLAMGRHPNQFRPHSNFSRAQWNSKSPIPIFDSLTIRSMCLASQSHFSSSPQCKPHKGLKTECRLTVTNKSFSVMFGECVLSETKDHRDLYAGGACWKGKISENPALPTNKGTIPTYNYFAFQDKWKLQGSLHKNRGTGKKYQRYSCGLPQGGAPLGRRSRLCTANEENFSVLDHLIRKQHIAKKHSTQSQINALLKLKQIPNELCANQGGNGFDVCAATGNSGACLKTRVARAVLDSCYPGNFCREDYICQKFPNYHLIKESDYMRKRRGKKVNQSSPGKINGKTIATLRAQNIGFCVPTYFLFNMRVDGHPSPVTGLPPGRPKFDRSRPLRGYKN